VHRWLAQGETRIPLCVSGHILVYAVLYIETVKLCCSEIGRVIIMNPHVLHFCPPVGGVVEAFG
jgi:hypothetical protein